MSVRRLGGAYGCKITRNSQISCAVAIAAYNLNKPVRMLMALTTNMRAIGKRYPCSCDYEVGINNEGEIQYLNNTLYMDFGRQGGNENPVHEVLDLFRRAYINDTWHIILNSVRTDTPTNTWCRAPGKIFRVLIHIYIYIYIDCRFP